MNCFFLINACQFKELLYQNYLHVNIDQKHVAMHQFWHTLIIYDIMIDIPSNLYIYIYIYSRTSSEVRQFLGMVSQLGKFPSNLSDPTKPLCDLSAQKAYGTVDQQKDLWK